MSTSDEQGLRLYLALDRIARVLARSSSYTRGVVPADAARDLTQAGYGPLLTVAGDGGVSVEEERRRPRGGSG